MPGCHLANAWRSRSKHILQWRYRNEVWFQLAMMLRFPTLFKYSHSTEGRGNVSLLITWCQTHDTPNQSAYFYDSSIENHQALIRIQSIYVKVFLQFRLKFGFRYNGRWTLMGTILNTPVPISRGSQIWLQFGRHHSSCDIFSGINLERRSKRLIIQPTAILETQRSSHKLQGSVVVRNISPESVFDVGRGFLRIRRVTNVEAERDDYNVYTKTVRTIQINKSGQIHELIIYIFQKRCYRLTSHH